jgi:hypothetical protein
MRRKTGLRIILVMAALVLAVVVLTKVAAEPWIGKKIQRGPSFKSCFKERNQHQET